MGTAKSYIFVIIAGLVATFLYDACAAALRSLGDTVTPLVILAISVALNIIGDLFFVVVLKSGVQGAAIATVLAQAIAFVVCWIYMVKRYELLRLSREDFRDPNPTMVKNMLGAGMSMGFMSSLINIGSLTLQTAINKLGNDYIVAQTAARKLTEMFMIMFTVFGNTMATYCGQNLGAGKIDRIKKGIWLALFYTCIWCTLVIVASYTIGDKLVYLVTGTHNENVILNATRYLKFDTLFYYVTAVICIVRNAMLGLDDHIFQTAISNGYLDLETVKYFEKDKALERRFQIVMVDEPDELSTISILRGLKERYENHHHVRIKDDAIIAAVELSSRYITDRFLPDKAIDLMDEAAAKLRMEVDSVPEGLDEISRKIKQLEIEREAIKRENDEPKLQTIGKELAELKEQEKSYKAKWQSEKSLMDIIQQNKVEIENLKFEADKAEREGNYGKVAEIRYGKLQELHKEIEDTQKKLHEMQGDTAMIKEEVDAEDIADVVSRWTGIPVSKMMQSEKDKLLHLEEELHQRVIGQDEAIAAVSDAVRRSRAGLQDPKRPIGSFIFLGTTGVGKTELAKALAEFLFDDETMMTRIDMSEYQEKHSVSRLVGAPPGYVGYDEGGQLTEAIRRKPYSVVLFDEIEKAHPDVFNILLQVLDDGRLTDNKGRVVNFKNTIIIMTSNMGSSYIQSQMEKLNGANNEEVVEETKKEVMNMLKKTIRPEFLNRIDETIMFLPLTEKDIKQIVLLQIKSVQKMLAGNGVELELTDAALDFLSQVGYDPEFGARPVKRAIQRYLLNDLSKKLLAQEVDRSKAIIVDAQGDGLVFRN